MAMSDPESARHEAARQAARAAFDQLIEVKRIVGRYEDGEINVHTAIHEIIETATGDARRVVRVGEQRSPEIQT